MTSLKQMIGDAAGKHCDNLGAASCDNNLLLELAHTGFKAGALWAFRLVLERWKRYLYLSQASLPLAEMLAFKSEDNRIRQELSAWAAEVLGEGKS